MSPNFETISNAGRNAVAEAQSLAAIAFGGFEKLVELNMATTKSILLQNTGDFFYSFSANNPSDALAAQASLVKPLAEQSISYAKSVYAIAAETSGALSQAAEAKLAQGEKAVSEVVENIAKNAPAGTEPVVAAFKAAYSAGQNAIESAKASAKKAVEVAERQAETVVDTALKSVKTTTSRKK